MSLMKTVPDVSIQPAATVLTTTTSCMKYGIAPICTVDERGYMNEEAGPECQGLTFEECSKKIITMMNEKGLLLAVKRWFTPIRMMTV